MRIGHCAFLPTAGAFTIEIEKMYVYSMSEEPAGRMPHNRERESRSPNDPREMPARGLTPAARCYRRWPTPIGSAPHQLRLWDVGSCQLYRGRGLWGRADHAPSDVANRWHNHGAFLH